MHAISFTKIDAFYYFSEPNAFLEIFNVNISGHQLAKDYCRLRAILDQLQYQQSILIGPEAHENFIKGDDVREGSHYIKEFLNNVEDCIDYFTWHQYYVNGRVAQVQDFVNSTVLNLFVADISKVNETLKSVNSNYSYWLCNKFFYLFYSNENHSIRKFFFLNSS